MTRLAGRRIAVIGAGAIGKGLGNGKAAALRFAEEGADVLCVDVDEVTAQETVEQILQSGGTAKALTLDVTVKDAGELLLHAMTDHFGGLDVMHFNVGLSHPGGIENVTDTDWTRPAESLPFTFLQRTSDNLKPTNLSRIRRACFASTRLRSTVRGVSTAF